MLSYLWAVMILLSFAVAVLTGRSGGLTEAVLSGGKEAVSLCIAMLGVVPLWTGIMRIGEKAGIIDMLKKAARPILGFLFPTIPYNSRAMDYIAANLAANFLGLGWAATPAGLMAMKELKKLNRGEAYADRAICMFLIINMSSVQLISVNLIAYRAKFSSAAPAEVTVPIIAATLFSTLAGVIYAKLKESGWRR